MSPPLVSVLLSVRDGMPYVPLTIASIRAQAFGEFEFVIVDNVSTDGTRDFLREIEREDSRVKLVFNTEDLGHSGGLNRGLEQCTGQWIARIDADDVALPQRLERQLAFVKEHPTVGVASCLAYYIDPAGRRVGKTFHDLATPADFQRYMAAGEMIGVLHPGALIDRRLAVGVGGYREPFRQANDIDLWARLAETGRLILVQQEYLMEYRIHPGQGSGRFFEARMRYEWARQCAVARRSGRPEPAWEQFEADWADVGWLRRWNRARKTQAKFFYRAGGVDFVCGRKLIAGAKFAAAAFLQPGYALRRISNQRLRKR